MPTEFQNEPLTDFSKEENAQAMRAALEKVKGQIGREYPLVIGGERILTEGKLDSINPAQRAQVVGKFQKATTELATRAVETAYETFQSWRHTPPQERAQLLFRVLICLIVGIVLTVAGAVYPAWQAARMQPIEAMRVET